MKPVPSAATRQRIALQVTLGSQVLIAFVPAIVPVIAPAMAPSLGVGAERLGVFTALTYLMAIVGGLASVPWMARFGPVRVIQAALLGAAAAIAIASSGHLSAVILAALLIGLAMGCPNPAFSSVLARHAAREKLGLYLSLRTAVAPAGIALAGLLLPGVIFLVGWQACLWIVGAICAAGGLAVGRSVRVIDWRECLPPEATGALPSLAMVISRPALRRLCLVALAYSMAQQGFLAYSVLSLVRLDVPLAAAAALLAFSQVAAILTRVVLGHVADRWVAPRPLLSACGGAIALACLGFAALPSAPPLWLAGATMVFFAATTMGWLGLLFAQLLRIVPLEEMAQCSGTAQVFTFGGAMLAPYLLALLFQHGVSHAAAYAGLAVLVAVAGASLFLHRPSQAAEQALADGLRRQPP